MRSRLALVMAAFPGMTPAQVWDLPQIEWWIVATAAEQWREERRRANRHLEDLVHRR